MAEIVGGFFMPHVPLITAEPDAPAKDKVARVRSAFAAVVERVRALEVDTVINIGADHYGLFGPHCVPQCLIAIGDLEGPAEVWLRVEKRHLPANEKLARHIMSHGHEAGVDWAFATSFTVDHATMVPYHLAVEPAGAEIRVIPIYLNEAVEPFIPSRRALQIGRQIRAAVESWPGRERVAVFGTGGISHWVGTAEMGRVNEQFDQNIMAMVESGDVEGMIALSDEEILATAGNGALEIKSWICAIGAVETNTPRVIAYEPVPEWCTGFGFAELKVPAYA